MTQNKALSLGSSYDPVTPRSFVLAAGIYNTLPNAFSAKLFVTYLSPACMGLHMAIDSREHTDSLRGSLSTIDYRSLAMA